MTQFSFALKQISSKCQLISIFIDVEVEAPREKIDQGFSNLHVFKKYLGILL